MALVTRTLVGAELQLAAFMGLPYAIRPNTTLNQKLNIEADQIPPAGTYPQAKILVIGNRGHRFNAGPDGEAYPEYVKHRPREQAPFRMIPFVLREESEDLTAIERQKYCLRTLEVGEDGVRRFAYYGYRLDYANVRTELINTRVTNGETDTVTFNHTNADLNPVQPLVLPNEAVQALPDGDYLAVRCMVNISLSPEETEEIVSACEIKFGNRQLAAISELQLCAGSDRIVPITEFGGGQVQFKESIATQVVAHVSTYNFLPASNNGAEFVIDLGISEALLTESQQGNAIASF